MKYNKNKISIYINQETRDKVNYYRVLHRKYYNTEVAVSKLFNQLINSSQNIDELIERILMVNSNDKGKDKKEDKAA